MKLAWPIFLLMIAAIGCKSGGVLDELKPKAPEKETPEAQFPEPAPGDVLWEEDFHLFDTDGGPDI